MITATLRIARRSVSASLAVMVVAASFAMMPVASFAVERGEPAPVTSLDGVSGKVIVAPRAGRWVYVDFWASWCAPCKRSFPWMNAMHAKHAARLDIIAINVDQRRADADRFLRSTPAQFTLAFDPSGDTPKRWNVKSMPSAYLVDPQGRVRMVHRGFSDGDSESLEQEILKIIDAK